MSDHWWSFTAIRDLPAPRRGTILDGTTTYDAYLGLDVGRTVHHIVALTTYVAKNYDEALP